MAEMEDEGVAEEEDVVVEMEDEVVEEEGAYNKIYEDFEIFNIQENHHSILILYNTHI